MAHRCPRRGVETAANTAAGSECRHETTDNAPDLSQTAPAGPWRRWAARMIDFTWTYLLLTCGTMQIPDDWRLNLAYVFASFLLDGLIRARCGDTLGKWLFGIRIVDAGTGLAIDRKTYFRRNLHVFLSGFGTGVAPLAALIAFFVQYVATEGGSPSTYDRRLGLRSVESGVGIGRAVFGGLLLILALLANAVLILPSIK